MVHCRKECCEAAKDLISALVADFEEKNYSCQAALPDIALSTVVGAKGATIRDIQAKSGARIDIVRDKQIAMLKGKKEHCDIAKDLITSLVENFMEKNFTCELAVPVPALPSVVGAKGATIRDLQDRSGARIDINRDKGLAVFKGKKENCEMAKELVVAFIQDYEEKNYSCDVRVPEAALAAVVGAKGAVIRDLQEKSGARIDINRDKGLAVLKGRKENCEKAMDLINEILEDGGFLQPKNKEADPAPAEDTPVVPKVRSGVVSAVDAMLIHVVVSSLIVACFVRLSSSDPGSLSSYGGTCICRRQKQQVGTAQTAPQGAWNRGGGGGGGGTADCRSFRRLCLQGRNGLRGEGFSQLGVQPSGPPPCPICLHPHPHPGYSRHGSWSGPGCSSRGPGAIDPTARDPACAVG